MRVCSIKSLALVCLLVAFLQLAVPSFAKASTNENSWQSQFQTQVLLHPAVVAIKEKLNAAESSFNGSGKSIYNPELSAEVEREGDSNNYRIGISKTFDWQDKVAVRQSRATSRLQSAKASFQMAVQTQTAEGLNALVLWRAASRQAVLTHELETQLDTMLAWIEERQKNGDVGQIDAELAVFGLIQRLNATAYAQATLKKVKAKVDAALPQLTKKQRLIPKAFWDRVIDMSKNADNMQAKKWLESHPSVLIAKAGWKESQSFSVLVKKDAKADPTIGINGGKTGNDNVLGLSLMLPLNVINNYSAGVKAAQQEALSMEAEYYAAVRQQKRLIGSSLSVLQTYQSKTQRWNQLMNGREERGSQLINQQWRSGDLSTPEYLLALNQLSEGLSAGIELEKQYELARIDWLLQSGQLSAALMR